MRTLLGLALVIFGAFTLVSCSTSAVARSAAGSSQKAAAAAAAAPLYPEVVAWLEQNRMTVNTGLANVPEQTQAFTQGAVIALGEGFPQAEANESGKKRLTAIRAAEAAAQRNLLDFFARRAAGGELHFDNAVVQLDGFVKGALIVASDYNPDRERAAVLLKLDLQGARGFAQ